MKPTDGAKKSVDAALATLAPLSDQDVAGTRVELVAKSQLSSGGKLSKALAAKIQRDRRQGLRDRLDQEQERLKALKKARKEREKRKSRGDILDDESGSCPRSIPSLRNGKPEARRTSSTCSRTSPHQKTRPTT